MELPKSVSTAAVKNGAPKDATFKKFWRSFEEFKAEFSRIQWSEEGEIVKTTRIVVISTFVSGLVLYGADLAMRNVLHGLEALFRVVVG